MSNYPVIKTLVIGLGSTGTRICDEIARRVEWELGGLSKAPWLRFLCLETNGNQESRFRGTGDFITLGLSAAEYQHILEYPQIFDEKIGLSTWADLDTLRKLPGHDVSGGAGNIRMVGRLVFLHETNYNNVKARAQERLERLRALSDNEATEQRGPLSDGSNPSVQFGASGQVRVVVVGTLCGGTCSGTVSDFGYFMKSIMRDGEKVVGVFTLPRHDLSPAVSSKADCFKKNAYHALLELNHYHLTGREGTGQGGTAVEQMERRQEAPIKVPDGVLRTDRYPYDLPYLAAPREVGNKGEQELNRAIGDRIFLNVFGPQTDPFAQAVDATIIDRQRRAHVFCSFGLSTVEFPVQQVMEACSKRLLAHALQHWQGRALETAEQESRISQLGLTWDALTDSLRTLPNGDSLKQRLAQKVEDIRRSAYRSPEEVEEKLAELRRAFAQQPVSDASGALPAGIVPHTFQTNRRNAAESVVDRLRMQIRAHLLDYHDGPAPLQQVLNQINVRLSQLQSVQAPTVAAQVETVDNLLKPLRAYHRSPLLSFTRLRKPAINRLVPKLEEAIFAEIRTRETAEAYRALQTSRVGNTPELGVLEWVSRLIKPVQMRTDKLRQRVTALCNILTDRNQKLARTAPLLNGVCIFEPETSVGGTVPTEYERCLIEHGGDLARDWRETRETLAAEVIREWSSLVDAIIPSTASTMGEDWLMPDFNPQAEQGLIQDRDLRALELKAKQPFLRLNNVDVLERWSKQAQNQQVTPALQAAEAARKAAPFLEVSPPLAERGGRSPIVRRSMILAPASQPQYREPFLQAAGQAFARTPATAFSPDRFRAVMLEEWFRFPLSGSTAILGAGGLHSATCGDFPEFHTRQDVHWTGLSEEEVGSGIEAEELVALGTLLGILKPSAGYLRLPWPPSGAADTGERLLSLDVRAASRLLALERKDMAPLPNGARGRSLVGAKRLLKDHIEQQRRACPGTGRERDCAFIRLLAQKLQHGVAGVRGWDLMQIQEQIERYCARDQALFDAYQEVYPPHRARIESLWRAAGDPLPGTVPGTCPEDGLYCEECGGMFGRSEQEAAQNGWRCFVDPSHVAFPRG